MDQIKIQSDMAGTFTWRLPDCDQEWIEAYCKKSKENQEIYYGILRSFTSLIEQFLQIVSVSMLNPVTADEMANTMSELLNELLINSLKPKSKPN